MTEKRRRKMNGVHYTPPSLAEHVAREIVRNYSFDGQLVRVLDPAVGGGELLSAILAECAPHSRNIKATGFDTDGSALHVSSERLRSEYPLVDLSLIHEDFLDTVVSQKGKSLFEETSCPTVLVDIVIANPPYVRTQALGAPRVKELADKFQLDGRVDLYQAFIKAISASLRPGGIAGIIASNRFMSIKSGAATRAGIAENFDILHIWDLGDTRLFEAAVLPAVLLLRRKDLHTVQPRSKFTSVYRMGGPLIKDLVSVSGPCEALSHQGLVTTIDGEMLRVQNGYLERGPNAGTWRLSTESSDSWLNRVANHTHSTFGNIGKIRVGVKTTADSVFMQPSWGDGTRSELPELLLPVTTHHVAKRYRSLPVERKILYPHTHHDGIRQTVDLEQFPISKRYLEKHRLALEERKYLRDGGRKWFEIWVPQDPSAWKKPKVVFRDIAEQPTFWMDLDGTVVNGDCYWITTDTDNTELLWLILAVANSRFIEIFYDHKFNNKLYSGRRRFMTQYVESFPLPDPTSATAARMIEISKDLYATSLYGDTSIREEELERLVCRSFGISHLPSEEETNSLVKGSESSCLRLALQNV
jgi:hypothetical protein